MTMNYQLKNIESKQGDYSLKFTATLYRNGKNIATVSNEGYDYTNTYEFDQTHEEQNFAKFCQDNNTTPDQFVTELMNRWELTERTANYHYWRRFDHADQRFVYNATNTKEPPTNHAGYYNLDTIKRIKGDS